MSSSGSWASNTRPTDVTWAGKRVPTVIVAVMMRCVGTRATYTMSSPSRTHRDDDSLICATSCSKCGSAISGRVKLDRYE